MRIAALFLTAATLGVAAWQAPADPCAGLRLQEGRCDIVTVPENRAIGQGRTIPLRVVVLPATGETRQPDPVFFLAGGPGQAASGMAAGHARNPLRASRDLVFVDQRGTGRSHPLNCAYYRPEDEASGRFADFLPMDRVRECRKDLERVADLAQYTTAASVADLDDVRKHLGYERINLAGGSYGTRLALEYLRAHPDRVRALVLDGAVPPSAAVPAGFGVTAQAALDGVLDECLADDACRAAFPQIRVRAGELFARLKERPIDVRVPGQETAFKLTADHVAEALRYLTYTTRGASRVPLLIEQAHGGDASGFLQELSAQRGRAIVGGLYLSITCAEDVPFVNLALVALDRETYLSDYRYRQQHAACAEWPRGAMPEASRTPVRSDVPALLVTGMLDPATPPAFADEVARTLPNSLVVKVPAGGHGLAGLDGLGCVNDIRNRFIEQGSVKGIDTSCVKSIRRQGFVLPQRR